MNASSMWPLISGLLLFAATSPAQPPAISNTTVSNSQLSFDIAVGGASNCVVQMAVGTVPLTWQTVAPATNIYSTPAIADGVPRHFRVQGEMEGTVNSVNLATCRVQLPPAGFSMFSFPLDLGGNTLAEVLPDVAEGTLLHWWKPGFQAFETAQFQFGAWTHPNFKFTRGLAVMLWSPQNRKPLASHGTFSSGLLTNFLRSYFNLIAPPTPFDTPTLPPNLPFLPPYLPCLDPGSLAVVLIGTDGIDPIYDEYYQYGLDDTWYKGFDPVPPPFPPFGGLWLWPTGCESFLWFRNVALPFNAAGPAAKRGATKSDFNGIATVYFNNYVPGFGINAPLTDTNGVRLAGTNWQAQLYVGGPGVPENELVPCDEPLPFLSGPQAGYLDTSKGALRYPTQAPDYSNGVAQIRFWNAQSGTNHESATLKGQTPMFLFPTRPPASLIPPVPLLGLASPELKASRVALPGAALTLRGYKGMSYHLEFSTNLAHWIPLVTLTNGASGASFTDPASHPQRFYRAVIGGPAE